MAVYFKFKSEKSFDSVSVGAPFISAGDLKIRIIFKKYSKRLIGNESKLVIGKDFDLELTNAQTNAVYTNDATLIPRHSAVFVRRVPGVPCHHIIVEQENFKDAVSGIEDVLESMSSIAKVSESRSTLSVANSSGMNFETQEKSEGDDFGDDIFAGPKAGTVESSDLGQKHMIVEERKRKELANKHAEEDKKTKELACKHSEEERKIQAFVEGLGRGMNCIIGRGKLLERKTPPEGYICCRCKMPGHYIQHCPTNDDPSYNKKKRPTVTPNGDSFLESIAVSRSAPLINPPPELFCPLCKKLIKDAAFASKCCFRSFCDECIRDHIISKSMCACGAREILADTLIPNKTLREIIGHFLESGVSREEKSRSSSQPSEGQLSYCAQSKYVGPAPAPVKEGTSDRKRSASGEQVAMCTLERTSDGSKTIPESEVIIEEAIHGNEVVSQGHNPPPAKEKILQRQPFGEPGNKKRKTMRRPANEADLYKGRSVGESTALNQHMNFGAAFNYQYWAGKQMQC